MARLALLGVFGLGAGFYEALPPVRRLGDGQASVIAGLRLPGPVTGSVSVPGGQIVVGLVCDGPRLGAMFTANWAPARPDQQPDALVYALARPAGDYGLDAAWDSARWWSPDARTLIVFGCASYRLVKVSVRGVCSAVSGDDIVFVHGCALSVGTGTASRGVLITGTSGAGKTTLVAELLRRAEHPVTVINDDWGAVSLRSGRSVSTGERRLHMKSGSVRALRPDFFTSAPPSSYRYDRSDPDRTARLLVAPQSVYGTSWGTGSAVIDAVAVIVREPPDWAPPARPWSARTVLGSGAHPDLARHGERFFNASLILPTGRDERREEHRYQRLLDRVTVCLINNCDTPDLLAQRFSSAVLA